MYNNYKYITDVATYTFYGTETKRVILASININKTLGGTLTIKAGSTTVGVLPAGTEKGQYWYTNHGTEFESLNMTNVAVEDITVFYRNI